MDIWGWVWDMREQLAESGNERLAQLMEEFPRAAIADDVEAIKAMYPEALGLARSLGLPWVEIFVRHWRLQALGGGYEPLAEAVELLEFSHREEHRACPQSVCVVQDVAIAYAGADGPGFARERLDVAEETLARIDTSWPCFTCITGERVSALVDAGRHEEAVAFADAQREALRRDGRMPEEREVGEAPALVALGRAEEALARLDEADSLRADDYDSSFNRERRLYRAQAQLALDRPDEARKTLETLDAVVDGEPPYQRRWAEAVEALVERGAWENDWRLGSRLESHVATQVRRGRAWDSVLVAGVHGRLALRRGAPATARHALEAGRRQAERLRSPEAAGAVLDPLEAAIAEHGDAASEPALPESAELFLESLGATEDPDPERDIHALEAARRRWPDDLEIAGALGSAHAALGRMDAAVAVTGEFAESHPGDAEAWGAHGFLLLRAGDARGAEEVAATLEGISETDGAWLRAQAAMLRGDHAEAARQAERVVALEPEAWNARRLWAMAAQRSGDFAEALSQYSAVIAGIPDEEADDDHWARLIPATVTGAWRELRESAARVGMELEGEEGPVDELWGLVRVRFDARDVRWAARTGPVSARVVEVSPPGDRQHAGDLVVFDPAPVDEPSEEDDEDAAPLLQVVKLLDEGGMLASAYDGVHPGDERWSEFRETLLDEGWLVWVSFLENYTLYDDDDEPRPGIYGGLAAPRDMDAATAHARLTELTAGWEHPFTWLELAEASGDEAALARQRADAERLALY